MKRYATIATFLLLMVLVLRGQSDIPAEENAVSSMRSVVRVHTVMGSGSGVIVECKKGKSGLWKAKILTAAHVVVFPFDLKVVVFTDRGAMRVYRAVVLESHRREDVALLGISRLTKPLPVMKVAELSTYYDDLNPGDKVSVIGCNLGSKPHIRNGLLSWTDAYGTEHGEEWGNSAFICHTATQFYGDSGGAVVNSKGELIGIVSRGDGVTSSLGVLTLNPAMNFAVPVTIADFVLKRWSPND